MSWWCFDPDAASVDSLRQCRPGYVPARGSHHRDKTCRKVLRAAIVYYRRSAHQLFLRRPSPWQSLAHRWRRTSWLKTGRPARSLYKPQELNKSSIGSSLLRLRTSLIFRYALHCLKRSTSDLFAPLAALKIAGNFSWVPAFHSVAGCLLAKLAFLLRSFTQTANPLIRGDALRYELPPFRRAFGRETSPPTLPSPPAGETISFRG